MNAYIDNSITPQDLIATGYSTHYVQSMMRIALHMLRNGRRESAKNRIVIDEIGTFNHEDLSKLRHSKLADKVG